MGSSGAKTWNGKLKQGCCEFANRLGSCPGRIGMPGEVMRPTGMRIVLGPRPIVQEENGGRMPCS